MASLFPAVQSWNWARGSSLLDRLPKKRVEGSRVRLGPFSLPLYTEFLEGGQLSPDWIGCAERIEEEEDSEDEYERARPVPRDYLVYVVGEDLLQHLAVFPQLYRSVERRARKAFKIIYHQKWLQPYPAPLPPGTTWSIDGPRFTPYKLLDQLYAELIFDPQEACDEQLRQQHRIQRKSRGMSAGERK
jgi:hypothetical protein